MAKKPLLSVVVPVCHAETGLRRCLDSLCRQDYPHLEIICVDDGSTDGTLPILQEYERRDSRIRVVQLAQGGMGSACNAGMELAAGEWLAFAGTDDCLLPRAYSTLMGFASTEVDMVAGGIRAEAASRAMKKQAAACRAAAKLLGSGVRRLEARHVPEHPFPLAAKLFRRSLIEQHHLRLNSSLRVGGDLCWYMSFHARARAAHFCRKELCVCMLRETLPPLACPEAGRWVDSHLALVDNLPPSAGRMDCCLNTCPGLPPCCCGLRQSCANGRWWMFPCCQAMSACCSCSERMACTASRPCCR